MQDYKEDKHGSRGHFILSGDSGSIIATQTIPSSQTPLSRHSPPPFSRPVFLDKAPGK